MEMLDWGGGQLIMLGVAGPEAKLSVPASTFYMDRAVLGCRYGSSRPGADIPQVPGHVSIRPTPPRRTRHQDLRAGRLPIPHGRRPERKARPRSPADAILTSASHGDEHAEGLSGPTACFLFLRNAGVYLFGRVA